MEPPEGINNFSLEDPEDELYGGEGGWWSWAYLPVEPPEGEETWIEDSVSRSGDRSVALSTQDWDEFVDEWYWGGYYVWSGQTAFDTENYLHQGDVFYMSAWVMHSSDNPLVGEANVQIELSFKDINGDNLSNLGYPDGRAWSPQQLDETRNMDEWHFLEMYIECPALEEETVVDRIDLVMRLFQTGPAWGVAYVDDVFMARGTPSTSDVKKNEPIAPTQFALLPNYPNPFNPGTTIPYQITIPSHVTVTIYDVLGRAVRLLKDSEQYPGHYTVAWDGRDELGNPMSSGTYFCHMEAGGSSHSRKILLMR